MADGARPSSGAARKARERRARANARHVQWLASNFQTLASHHTQPFSAAWAGHVSAEEVASLRRELEVVRGELAALRKQVGVALEEVQMPGLQQEEEHAVEADVKDADATDRLSGTAGASAAEVAGAGVAEPRERSGLNEKSLSSGSALPVPASATRRGGGAADVGPGDLQAAVPPQEGSPSAASSREATAQTECRESGSVRARVTELEAKATAQQGAREYSAVPPQEGSPVAAPGAPGATAQAEADADDSDSDLSSAWSDGRGGWG